MKKMYWRPRRVSRIVLALISLASIAGYAGVERFKVQIQEPWHQEKLAASRLAENSFKAIRVERLRRGLPIDVEADPAQSGLIGTLMTPNTSNTGSLSSKQTSVNPNFAGVMVHYFKKAGVREGDVVAVGYSGSFPAINVAVLAAIETLKLKPVIIASAASSQWGANEPDLNWLDMEQVLFDQKLISHRAVAASIGGIEDKALGMTKRGRTTLEQAIQRSNLPMIAPTNFAESIVERMRIYREQAGGEPIKAYVNVGGGTTSVGKKIGKLNFKPGLNRELPGPLYGLDSVMARFVEEGVPVIHWVKINQLADHYGFPLQPQTTPAVGTGKIFVREDYNRWLVAGLLLAIIAGLYLFVRTDLGFRMTQGGKQRSGGGHPEPMV
jgi:poly-gamma-glutamate system protein